MAKNCADCACIGRIDLGLGLAWTAVGATQLLGAVCEEANGAIAFRSHVAHLSLVPLGVQARLEHAVRIEARVAVGAVSVLMVRAVGSHVGELHGVPPRSLLALVGKRAGAPVVCIVLHARSDLQQIDK